MRMKDKSIDIQNTYATAMSLCSDTSIRERTIHTRIYNSFINNNRNIVLKGRQVGLSTLAMMYIGLEALSKPNTSIIVIASNKHQANNLGAIMKDYFNGLCSTYKPKFKTSNTNMMVLSNGSAIRYLTRGEDASQSDILYVDEAAYIKLPSVDNFKKVILVSSIDSSVLSSKFVKLYKSGEYVVNTIKTSDVLSEYATNEIKVYYSPEEYDVECNCIIPSDNTSNNSLWSKFYGKLSDMFWCSKN